MIFIILVFGNVPDILLQHYLQGLALITLREMWGLGSRSRTSRSRSRLLWQSLGLVSKLEPGLGLCLGGYGLDSRLHHCHYPAGYPTGKPDSDHLCVGGVQELEFRTRSGLRPDS